MCYIQDLHCLYLDHCGIKLYSYHRPMASLKEGHCFFNMTITHSHCTSFTFRSVSAVTLVQAEEEEEEEDEEFTKWTFANLTPFHQSNYTILYSQFVSGYSYTM